MGMSPAEMVCSSAVRAATDSAASLVVVLPEAVSAIDLVAKYRPKVPILAMDHADRPTKDLSLLRGVLPVTVTEATLADSRGQSSPWTRPRAEVWRGAATWRWSLDR